MQRTRPASEGYQCWRSGLKSRKLMRLRDELWLKGREWFQEKGVSMPQDDALIAELTAPTYTFSSTGKMVVESKADLKKRGLRRLIWPTPSS